MRRNGEEEEASTRPRKRVSSVQGPQCGTQQCGTQDSSSAASLVNTFGQFLFHVFAPNVAVR